MNNQTAIRKTSRRFRIFFTVLAVISPLFPVVLWGAFNQLPDIVRDRIFNEAGAGAVRDISPVARGIGFGAGFLSSLITAYAFYCLVRLFSLYEQGKIFMDENVALYRRLGVVILASVAAGIAVRALSTVALTIDNPSGHRMLSVGLSSSDITALIIGLLVMLVARIMEVGRDLREDHELTV